MRSTTRPSGLTTTRDRPACRRSARPTAARGDRLVLVAARRRSRAGSPGRPGGAAAASAQVVQPGLRDGGDRRPAHPEVALDGPGDRAWRRRPRGPGRPRCTGVGVDLDDAVHVGGRAADVDHDHVADAGVRVAEPAGEQLDAGQHDVRGRAADHRGEVGARAEVLAADHVGEEHLADRAPRGVRGEHADPGHDVVGQHVAARRRGSRRPRRGRRRCRPRRPVRASRRPPAPGRRRAAPRRCRRPCRPSAARRPAGRPRGRARSGRRRAPARGRDDRDHLAAAGQGDPATGLGGHELLVADDRDPQATAGAGAGQHLGGRRAGVLPDERRQAGVVPVEDVGVDRRRGGTRTRRSGRRSGRPARPW